MLPLATIRQPRPYRLAILCMALMTASTARAADCNGNGIDDAQDIAALTSSDCDTNGTPDECQIKFSSAAPGGPFFCIADCDSDCNDSGVPDACETRDRLVGVNPDFALEIDIHTGTSQRFSHIRTSAFTGVRGLAFDASTDTIYASDIHLDYLIAIDLNTGVVRPIGPLGFGDVEGLAFDRVHSVLYGTDIESDQLLRIDVSTGHADSIGHLGYDQVVGLTFDPSDEILYGCDRAADRLLRINTQTGKAEPVATLRDMEGLAFDEATDKLYAADYEYIYSVEPASGATTRVGAALGYGQTGAAFDSNRNALISSEIFYATLTSFQLNSGTHEVIAKLGFADILDLAYDNWSGRLFGTDGAYLLSIDKATGKATAIGPYVVLANRVWGLEFAEDFLYGVDNGPYSPSTAALFKISETTGTASSPLPFSIGGTGLFFLGLAFDWNTENLYVTNLGKLFVIRPLSGHTQFLFTPGVWGLADDPATSRLYGTDITSRTLVHIDPLALSRETIGPLGFRVFGLAASSADQSLYGISLSQPDGFPGWPSAQTDQLIRINPHTAAASTIGALGLDTLQGMAFDPNARMLYGLDRATKHLVTIDIQTGESTIRGQPVLEDVTGVAFDWFRNVLYGVDASSLLTIDALTGERTAIGPTGFTEVRGLTFDPSDLLLWGIDSVGQQLLRINAETGAATPVGVLPFQRIESLAFDPKHGNLYGVDVDTNQLLVIDKSSASATSVGRTYHLNIQALAFISGDCDGNGLLDVCEGDLDHNGVIDACEPPECGDGVLSEGEECDMALLNSDETADRCRTDCLLPRCGDDVMDSGEECDAGTANSDALPDACRTDCRFAHCGDGVVDSGEQCDGDDTPCPGLCASDCSCAEVIPTVSTWGMAVLALLSLTIAKIPKAHRGETC